MSAQYLRPIAELPAAADLARTGQGILAGKEGVQQPMQQNGIRARGKRRFRVTTTDSQQDLPIASNLLNRNSNVAASNQVWVGYITYIATDEVWLFLASVIDLFQRQVVSWSMRPDMQRDLVIDALEGDGMVPTPHRRRGRADLS